MFGSTTKFGMGRVYLDATIEARRRGDRSVGTDHIALAMLSDPESVTARALGISLADAREALETLDQQALASVGITPGPRNPLEDGRESGRLRLTPAGRSTFTGLRSEVAKGDRLGPQHVLLALLSLQRPDPASELLDALKVDRAEVRRRVAVLT